MGRIAVFSYGSLVDRASAGRTLGRPVAEVWPARLEGFARRFSQARDNRTCEKTFARGDTGEVPEWILGLNVQRDERLGQAPNGALVEVSEADLARLDLREIRYDRIEVGDCVRVSDAAPAFDTVITYTAKAGHLASEPPPGAVILRAYAEAVEAAFASLGPEQLEDYRATTPYPVELVDGELIRDEIPEGNPREW